MNKTYDLFGSKGHAAVYAKYRAKPPRCILDRILAFLGETFSPPFQEALDVGCGSGQSTDLLADNFVRVTGVDISDAQIDAARKTNTFENVSYNVGTESHLAFGDHRLQLITASQCFHWLDLPSFYKEAKRVLLPGGVLCIYFYQLPYVVDKQNGGSDLERIFEHVSSVEMVGFWDERRLQVANGLHNFHFPFEDVVKEEFTVDAVMTVSEACGFVKSWSPYQRMLRESPERATKIIDGFRERLLMATKFGNPDEIVLDIRYPYCFIMGRV